MLPHLLYVFEDTDSSSHKCFLKIGTLLKGSVLKSGAWSHLAGVYLLQDLEHNAQVLDLSVPRVPHLQSAAKSLPLKDCEDNYK